MKNDKMTSQLTNWENKLQMKRKTRRKGEEGKRRKGEMGGRKKERGKEGEKGFKDWVGWTARGGRE